jgi:hypothetical protein
MIGRAWRQRHFYEPALSQRQWCKSLLNMTRVYVGNLPLDVKEREIDDIFYKYGRITDVQIKRPDRSPAFGKRNETVFIPFLLLHI